MDTGSKHQDQPTQSRLVRYVTALISQPTSQLPSGLIRFAEVESPLSAPGAFDPDPPEVSWQTLFWIITTLALNSMTQPFGRAFRTVIRD
ncbi:hypothetical protein WAI453_004726 [Rhynchosporium graminicola]